MLKKKLPVEVDVTVLVAFVVDVTAPPDPVLVSVALLPDPGLGPERTANILP